MKSPQVTTALSAYHHAQALRRKENGLALFNRRDRSQSNDEAIEPAPDAVISTDRSDNDYFPPTRYTGIFASFHYSDFRLLWIGQLGWSGANWMEQIARNWLIWELTGSGFSLGLVNLFRALPQLFMALPSGVAADRFNKKYVLMACQ